MSRKEVDSRRSVTGIDRTRVRCDYCEVKATNGRQCTTILAAIEEEESEVNDEIMMHICASRWHFHSTITLLQTMSSVAGRTSDVIDETVVSALFVSAICNQLALSL